MLTGMSRVTIIPYHASMQASMQALSHLMGKGPRVDFASRY